jgi:hypothetical protein
MATYWRIWGGTTSIQISSLRLILVLGVGFFLLEQRKFNLYSTYGTPNQTV